MLVLYSVKIATILWPTLQHQNVTSDKYRAMLTIMRKNTVYITKANVTPACSYPRHWLITLSP